jgi:hypothetical protein
VKSKWSGSVKTSSASGVVSLPLKRREELS